MKKLGLLMGVLVLAGCSKTPYIIEQTPVKAVFMHQPHIYSVAVETDNGIKIKKLPQFAPVKIVYGDSKSYSCDFYRESFFGTNDGYCTITIRDIDDIHGAGWDNGKHGSGTTIRIQ